MFRLGYKKGKSFDTSYLIAQEGSAEPRVVKASLVLPKEIQALEKSKPSQVVSPKEYMKELLSKVSSLKEFDEWAKAETASVVRLNKRASLSRRAYGVTEGQDAPTFSRNEGEVVMPEGVKSGVHGEADVDWARNSKESETDMRDDTTRSGGGKVPSYFGRFPKTQVSDPERAFNPQSKMIKEQASTIAKLTDQINVLTKKAKESDVKDIMQKISTLITSDEKGKWMEKLSNVSEADLSLFSELLTRAEANKKAAATREAVETEEEPLPQIFDSSINPSATEDLASIMMQIDESKQNANVPM